MNKSFASSYSRVVNITVNFLLVYICFLNDGAALIGWTDRRVYIFNLHHLIVSKIQGMDLEITTAAALRGHSRGHSSPKKITALPSNRMVNTSIEIINTSIKLINTSIELINTSIETYVALAFSFMHALNIMFTSPQAITQSLAIML